MDGPMQLSGPLRPVPIYCRRPLELELDLSCTGSHLPGQHRARNSPPGSSPDKVAKETIRPAPPPLPHQHQHQPLSALPAPPHLLAPHRLLHADLLSKGSAAIAVFPAFGKLREHAPPPPLPPPPPPPPPSTTSSSMSSLDKNGVPLITPVRGPDPRSVALYQSLLRHHPAYHHLLETFLFPPLPPLLCHPAAALCADSPFGFCGSVTSASAAAAPLPAPRPPSLSPAAASASSDEEKRRVPARPPPPPPAAPVCNHRAKDSPPPPPPPRQAILHPTESSQLDGKIPSVAGGGAVSAEELVSSITAVPDPYQQYGYGRKLFPCPQCRYTTDRRNNLKRHMLTMHQLSAKMLECCGVLFRTKAALREHALIFHYHGYTCFYCGRRFCRKALLKRHLSVHNGQKEFICNVCDYATSHKSNLERHRRVHMRQDDDISGMDCEATPSVGQRELMSGNISEDDISVCSHDDESEEINVHSD